MRVALVQMEHGDALDANLARARSLVERARDAGAALALLPEYFFSTFRAPPSELASDAPRVRAMLADASRDLGILVAANVIERRDEGVLNVGVVYDRGASVLEQPKLHPMPREAAAGVAGGARLAAGDAGGRRVGMLVCADILYPEAARVLQLQGAEVLLNPVMSPWRAVDDTKSARDAVFVARAYDAGAFVLKAGGFRAPRGDPPMGVAGRSLAAAPWGLLARYRDDFAEEVLLADLDFDRLAEFRKHQATFPPRRPDAYEGLL